MTQISQRIDLDVLEMDTVHRALVLLRIVAETKIASARVPKRDEQGEIVLDDYEMAVDAAAFDGSRRPLSCGAMSFNAV